MVIDYCLTFPPFPCDRTVTPNHCPFLISCFSNGSNKSLTSSSSLATHFHKNKKKSNQD